MTKGTAYMITDMLKGVIDDSNGTGTAAKLSGVYQAGKTGTTDYPSGHSQSGVMDSWMAGYTKNYSIAVWTGYDQPMSHSISGSYERSAILLYKALMDYLDNENHASNWKRPSSVEAVRWHGHRELVLKDSKWALDFTAIDDDDDSSHSSSHSDSSSSSSLSSSESSYFNKNSSSSASSSSASQSDGGDHNQGASTESSSASPAPAPAH